MKRSGALTLVFILVASIAPEPSHAASVAPVQASPSGDSLNQGLWWLYQLRYEKAHTLFEEYAKSHPKDAAGYFYMTATDWWQLAQEFDAKLPDIETRMERDYERTIAVAKDQLDGASNDHDRALACLYWGGAEGLKGRWLVAQKQWITAYFLGKRGNHLLHRALGYDKNLYDAYMGIGIYDYFTDTLSGVIGALSTILIHGDRKRGLKELQWAIDQGTNARVESMIFLIEIYTWDEGTPAKALPLSQELHREFPTSPAMYLAEIMDYYQLGKWPEVASEAEKFLALSQNETPYYTKEGVRPAHYCLGVAALQGTHDLPTALNYFNHLLEKPDDSRWVTFAYLRRGQVYDVKGDRQKALVDYRRVLERRDFWGSHREAERFTKQAYSLRS